MNLTTLQNLSRRWPPLAATVFALLASSVQAANAKGPASKLFVTDVVGTAEINIGDKVSELEKRSLHTANGTIIETKRMEDVNDKRKSSSSMVYSNGTGMVVGEDTRVEVKRFVQEPFLPNRSDMDQEPSVSQTQAFVARGTVGLCTSKLAIGSTMVYQTPNAAINVRGRRVVIESNEKYTKISMLEGESTVRAGNSSTFDLAGQVIHAGQQAIIMAAPPGVVPQMLIVEIPAQDMGPLNDKVAMACTAKKTVYFDTTEKKTAAEPATKDEEKVAKDEEQKDDPAHKDSITEANVPEGLGFAEPVTAFDDSSSSSNTREIVAIEVTPAQLPTEYTASKAKLTK